MLDELLETMAEGLTNVRLITFEPKRNLVSMSRRNEAGTYDTVLWHGHDDKLKLEANVEINDVLDAMNHITGTRFVPDDRLANAEYVRYRRE